MCLVLQRTPAAFRTLCRAHVARRALHASGTLRTRLFILALALALPLQAMAQAVTHIYAGNSAFKMCVRVSYGGLKCWGSNNFGASWGTLCRFRWHMNLLSLSLMLLLLLLLCIGPHSMHWIDVID